MSEYTPTDDEVRAQWGIAVDYHRRPERLAEFDRMIAEVERAAAEKAWGEGHAAGRDYQADGWNSDAHDPQLDNPYRLNEGEKQ